MTTSKSMPSIGPDKLATDSHTVHVAAGVIVNSNNEVLIAKRPSHVHQGGLWEFPGGKIETGEDVVTALKRELHEELNLSIDKVQALIRIPWQYADKAVVLHVLRVLTYTGEAKGMEGQALEWVSQQNLKDYDFPAANRAIIQAIDLPVSYMISGEFKDTEDFGNRLESQLIRGQRLLQLRIKHLSAPELEKYVQLAGDLCQRYQASLLINSEIELAKKYSLGLHLSSRQLMQSQVRPLEQSSLLAASVHNETELQQANQLGVDFVVLSPVRATPSHPDILPMGWDEFERLTAQAKMPVYALGGMTLAHIDKAQQRGAQGIAAISEFWNKHEAT